MSTEYGLQIWLLCARPDSVAVGAQRRTWVPWPKRCAVLLDPCDSNLCRGLRRDINHNYVPHGCSWPWFNRVEAMFLWIATRPRRHSQLQSSEKHDSRSWQVGKVLCRSKACLRSRRYCGWVVWQKCALANLSKQLEGSFEASAWWLFDFIVNVIWHSVNWSRWHWFLCVEDSLAGKVFPRSRRLGYILCRSKHFAESDSHKCAGTSWETEGPWGWDRWWLGDYQVDDASN